MFQDAMWPLSEAIARSLGAPSHRRTEKQSQVIELVLCIVRNLLAIQDKPNENTQAFPSRFFFFFSFKPQLIQARLVTVLHDVQLLDVTLSLTEVSLHPGISFSSHAKIRTFFIFLLLE